MARRLLTRHVVVAGLFVQIVVLLLGIHHLLVDKRARLGRDLAELVAIRRGHEHMAVAAAGQVTALERDADLKAKELLRIVLGLDVLEQRQRIAIVQLVQVVVLESWPGGGGGGGGGKEEGGGGEENGKKRER